MMPRGTLPRCLKEPAGGDAQPHELPAKDFLLDSAAADGKRIEDLEHETEKNFLIETDGNGYTMETRRKNSKDMKTNTACGAPENGALRNSSSVVLILTLALFGLLRTDAPAACVVPAPGLMSWWAADGNANDNFGGNPAILTNGTTFAAGLVGQAFSFDGVDDLVTSPAYPLTSVLNTFTMEFWVLPTAGRTSTSQSTSGTAGTNG